MKSLSLQSAHFLYLEKSYQEWLQTIGYADPTVNNWPAHVHELLHYLEGKGVQHITTVSHLLIQDFIFHIKYRRNHSRPGALSSSSINTIINAINSFAKYLNSTGKYVLDLTFERAETDQEVPVVLSVKEIRELYEATFTSSRENPVAMGQRDRAMIAIFYGCGLRKMEGTMLNLSDIDLQKRRVFVRKGKGNKQRYVPIAEKHADDIRAYIQEGRDWFLYEHYAKRYTDKYTSKKGASDNEFFFIGKHGDRMIKFYQRLSLLKERAGIEKPFGLHTLRHSIATHLAKKMEYFRQYLQQQKLKGRTIEEHSKNVGYFESWLKQEDYGTGTTIQYADLLSYIQFEKAKGITPATINLRLSSIKYYFEYLKSIGEVARNPAKTIRVKGTVSTIIENPLSMEELETLYHQYSQLSVPEHLAMIRKRSIVILCLMIWQGVHSGELQKMEITHIDLNNASVYIPSTSQSNYRQLSINSKQLLLLHQYLSDVRPALKPKGNELIVGSVRNHVQRLLQEVQGINPMIRNAQQIRGSVILGWLKKHSKRQVQYMAGHKYISSTEKYVQQEVDSLKDVLSKHHPFG